MRIALGVEAFGLEVFALAHRAETSGKWAPDGEWKVTLVELAPQATTEFFWNLPQRDIVPCVQRASSAYGAYGATDWELLLFCQHPEWRSRSRFFFENSEIDDPFLEIPACN
jgi:hypothetical protein